MRVTGYSALIFPWGPEDQIGLIGYFALVYFMGTSGPNESDRIFCSCISWRPEDQMRVTGYFALVYFMESRGPIESDRIFCSCIFHGDQRNKLV
jgi:hypothetical protein